MNKNRLLSVLAESILLLTLVAGFSSQAIAKEEKHVIHLNFENHSKHDVEFFIPELLFKNGKKKVSKDYWKSIKVASNSMRKSKINNFPGSYLEVELFEEKDKASFVIFMPGGNPFKNFSPDIKVHNLNDNVNQTLFVDQGNCPWFPSEADTNVRIDMSCRTAGNTVHVNFVCTDGKPCFNILDTNDIYNYFLGIRDPDEIRVSYNEEPYKDEL